MRCLQIIAFLLTISGKISAQQAWIYLKPECSNTEQIIQELNQNCIQTLGYSKWMHAIAVKNLPNQGFSFIHHTEIGGKYQKNMARSKSTDFAYGRTDWQLQMLGLDSFHRMGYTGKGVTIALMDAGFYRVDSFEAFKRLWQNNSIKYAYDFVDNDSTVFDTDAHGMSVLSIVGGYLPDSLIGAAPDADFLLFRTENAANETHQEEFNWIKAMELADSMGADIIHSSLGYSLFDSLQGDYTYFDMDGKSTFITRATDSAFARGMFITNSAGNSGEQPWRYITAPCDGRFVLCVGAVDSFGQKAGFSSFGPSADGRVKPEVMAMGQKTTVINSLGYVTTGNGTSFSGPLMAGFVACLKQAHPWADNYRLYRAIIQSADRYNTPDSAYGYGIPNILKADSILKAMVHAENRMTGRISIYPNPGKELLQINGVNENALVTICDMQGRQLLQTHAGRLPAGSELPSGFYVVYIQNQNGTYTLRWIKNE